MDHTFTQMQQSAFETFRKVAQDQAARAAALAGEWQKMQALAIDEWARLGKESLRYHSELLATMQTHGTELADALAPKKAG